MNETWTEPIPFVDADSGSQGFFLVRRTGETVAITVSLERDGDIEVFVPCEVARRLTQAVERAVAQPG